MASSPSARSRDPAGVCIVVEHKGATDVRQLVQLALSSEPHTVLAATDMRRGLRYVAVFAYPASAEDLERYTIGRRSVTERLILYTSTERSDIVPFCQQNGVEMRPFGFQEIWRILDRKWDSNGDRDDIDAYVDAYAVASNRSRSVLILIVVACVVVFSALWNAVPNSWINARVAAAQENQTQCHGSRADADCRLADEEVSEAMKVKRENVTLIKIPFFGVAIDVDDLGIIGGFTLWILLLWFRFSLRKECECLQVLFLTAGENNQRAYDLAAMRQESTIPPMLQQQRRRDAGWIRFVYWLPIVFQAAVLIADFWIYRPDISVSKNNVIGDYLTTLFAAVVIFVVTLQCSKLLSTLEGIWNTQAQALGRQENSC